MVVAGIEVRRGALPLEAVEAVARLVWLDLLAGHGPDLLREWVTTNHWAPHLRWTPEVEALRDALPDDWRQGTPCEPQLLLQPPHVGGPVDVTWHLDREPGWATTRYARIVGVPLTPWTERNGGLLVRGRGRAWPVEAEPGDVVCLDPDLPHSGGINLSPAPRLAAYFRWLT